MSPTLVFRPKQGVPVENKFDLNDQKLVMAFGASGGPKIPTATLQAFVNYFFLGMPLYDSIVRPRLHDQLLYKGFATTLYDNDHLLAGPTIQTPMLTREALEKRGHVLAPVTNTGCVQAVGYDLETGLISAVSDPRKGGRPSGY
jgi:gamma-glutamyltranspeptidase